MIKRKPVVLGEQETTEVNVLFFYRAVLVSSLRFEYEILKKLNKNRGIRQHHNWCVSEFLHGTQPEICVLWEFINPAVKQTTVRRKTLI